MHGERDEAAGPHRVQAVEELHPRQRWHCHEFCAHRRTRAALGSALCRHGLIRQLRRLVVHAAVRQPVDLRRDSRRRGGHWSIHPDSEFRVERQYLPGSMVLLTTFYTSTGILELCDAMALGDTHDPHALGERPPPPRRTATFAQGRVRVVMSFRARPEYGLITPVTTGVLGGMIATGVPTG